MQEALISALGTVAAAFVGVVKKSERSDPASKPPDKTKAQVI
jgi:hypothetical protein